MRLKVTADNQLLAQAKLIELFTNATRSRFLQSVKKRLVGPSLLFNQRGKIAGSARLLENVIKLNPTLYHYNQSYFLEQVIAHELAHILVYQKYGRSAKPHGAEWQHIMQDVFNLQPDVTHQLDTSVLGYKTFQYKCGCQIIELSQTRHNKVQRNIQQYKCRKCHEVLSLI